MVRGESTIRRWARVIAKFSARGPPAEAAASSFRAEATFSSRRRIEFGCGFDGSGWTTFLPTARFLEAAFGTGFEPGCLVETFLDIFKGREIKQRKKNESKCLSQKNLMSDFLESFFGVEEDVGGGFDASGLLDGLADVGLKRRQDVAGRVVARDVGQVVVGDDGDRLDVGSETKPEC